MSAPSERCAPQKPSRPRFAPTERQRAIVAVLKARGFPHHQICHDIINPHTRRPISEKTLSLHFADELAEGEMRQLGRIEAHAYGLAMRDDEIGTRMTMFLLKTKAGYKEAFGPDAALGVAGGPIEERDNVIDLLSRRLAGIAQRAG